MTRIEFMGRLDPAAVREIGYEDLAQPGAVESIGQWLWMHLEAAHPNRSPIRAQRSCARWTTPRPARSSGAILHFVGGTCVDAVRGDPIVIDELLAERPPGHAVTVLDLGCSTSVRNGGIYLSQDGGALRTMLTYAANSRYVAYLDDDNWIQESHLVRPRAAIEGQDWVYTLRWYVDPDTLEPMALDR